MCADFATIPKLITVLTVLSLFFPHVFCHSAMSGPESTAPMTCRLGGEAHIGVDNCAGPCDLRAIQVKYPYANFYPPDKPAATYSRGEKVTIKYQRNNHGPGGFNRLTLVPIDDMMNKKKHEENAFHWSCWGAKPVRANEQEKKKDKYGFSIVGNDGEEHNEPIGYYKTEITIPTVIPDGKYMLGWVWFGGTGGDVQGNEPQEPTKYGYFSDYWSCSFVIINGGPTTDTYERVFDNDMPQYSSEGCMSANDRPGVCTYEPCKVDGIYQKPKEFKNGQPPPLTLAQFGGFRSNSASPPKPDPPAPTPDPPAPKPDPPAPKPDPPAPKPDPPAPSPAPPTGGNSGKPACRCLSYGSKCWPGLAKRTGGKCNARTDTYAQSAACRTSCCSACKSRKWAVCKKDPVKSLCGI